MFQTKSRAARILSRLCILTFLLILLISGLCVSSNGFTTSSNYKYFNNKLPFKVVKEVSSFSTDLSLGSYTSSKMISSSINSQHLRDKLKGCLFGLFVGDAVAMPVHWMYDLRQLKADYGVITGYTAPREKFKNSIMSLSNTGGGGRGSSDGDIIGTVINHGKKKYWVRGGDYHYHVGLQAGENTLEAQLARVLMRDVVSHAGFDPNNFLTSYVEFMTSPGSHNDTYASTCHRMFFANMVRGKALSECADNDGHNVDTIDALTLTTPIISLFHKAPLEETIEQAQRLVRTTRKSAKLDKYVGIYTRLLVKVLHGEDLRQSLEVAGQELLGPSFSLEAEVASQTQRGAADPMVACYIDSSFPAMLFYTYKYADSVETGVLASANGGGENVARGSLVGALLGAAYGYEGFPAWAKDGLHKKDEVAENIETFLDVTMSSSSEDS